MTTVDPDDQEKNMENPPENINTLETMGIRKSLSPRKPDGTPPSSSPKNYELLYTNLKRRYKDLAEISDKKKQKALMDYNIMNKKVTDLQAENKSQEAEIERLAQLEIMHRTELEGKELAITSQCDTTEQMIKIGTDR